MASQLNKPIHTERQLRIICVGAGASGLLLAYKLQRSFRNFSLTVYEKNDQVSGTWYENKYPGCACDVPAHNYNWTFEPKADWSSVYATSGEIYQYFNSFADKYGLREFCKVQHEIAGARWNEDKGTWTVTVKDLVRNTVFKDTCHIMINASGILNAWKWPAIPGLENYKGVLLHSAAWDDNVDLRGKHVGLIGNGSSGIQILPAIQPIVSKLTTFIREATWISPPFGLDQRIYTHQEISDFTNRPELLLDLRRSNERSLNSMFGVYIRESQTQADIKAAMKASMEGKIQDLELQHQLIPSWGPGCRRLTPGINYLETLQSPNVEVVYGEIEKVTENGPFCDNKNEYFVDVLICATGFDTSFRPRFPIEGPTGNLQDAWAKEPKSYLGLAAADVPNYFVFLGPSCPVGNGPLIPAIECQCDYMLKLIDRWQTEDIHSFSPKLDAVNDFAAHTDLWMKRAIWQQDCRSWYKNGSASSRVTALWPGSTLHYIEMMGDLRADDWNIKYQGNRFSFMGNGYSQAELDPTCDLGYYIRDFDDAPHHSRAARREALTKSGSINPRELVNTVGWAGDPAPAKASL